MRADPRTSSTLKHFGRALGAAALGALLAQGVPARAESYPNLQEADLTVKDFHLANGETLPEAKFHYTTLGTAERNAQGEITNAVLLLHGTSGTGKNFLAPSLAGELFGKGQPLDAGKYFIILPDGLGRGGSSKPSDGMKGHFPHYGYKDVVEGQYRVVMEGLGIKHLKLVLGTSMGGMQVWMWGEAHPDMMDALMPVAAQPIAIAGRNMLWRRLVIESVRADPEWHNGDYETEPALYTHFYEVAAIMQNSALSLQKEAPTRAAANEYYDKAIGQIGKLDANDLLYWFESSYDYDPSADIEKIKAKVVAVNFGDDLLNPPELGVMEAAMKRLKHGRYVLVPGSDKTKGHQTLALASVWGPYVKDALK
jgi:homoserine O-acetyltransferase/O-succinyltransferase